MEENAWLAHFLPMAEAGDVDAQIALGWEYAAGRMVKADLGESERWFRAAEKTLGERSLFYLIKALLIKRSERADAVFNERKEWNLGAIYMLYGGHLFLNGRQAKGLELLKTGWERGNLFSGLHYLRHRYGVIGAVVSSPLALYIVGKIVYIKYNNKDDDRVLK